MFVSFSVENYQSYKDKATFDFIKDRIKPISKENLRKISIILGGNASGKSNLFKAIFCSQQYILESLTDSDGSTLLLYAPYDNSKQSFLNINF